MNSRLLDFLESLGTKLPQDKELFHAGLDARGNFTQGACLFCVEPLPELGRASVIQYYNDLSNDIRFRQTPYSACQSCYHHGLAKLDAARKEFAMRDISTPLIFKNGKFVTERLVKYIESKGRKIPDDYKKYRSGGSHAESCLFCSDVPADYPVDIIYNENWRVDSNTYCCYTCHESIQREMEPELAGSIWAGFNTETINRINAYIERMEFDETVEEHYQHLLIDRDDDPNYNGPFGTLMEHCYFCKVLSRAYRIMQVPVSVSRRLTGGGIRVCGKCEHKIDRLRITNAMIPNPRTLYEMDVCGTCGADYPITIPEHRQRDADGSLEKHMCPECAHKTVWRGEPNEIFDVSSVSESRYKVNECHYCTGNVLFDLTLTRRILSKKYVSSENKPICNVCSYRNKFPIFVEHEPETLNVVRYYKFQKGYVAVITPQTSETSIETIGLECQSPEEAPVLLARIRNGKK